MLYQYYRLKQLIEKSVHLLATKFHSLFLIYHHEFLFIYRLICLF